MPRCYNFSAGPSMLPESVLAASRDELLEYGNSGMSVLEMSHRSKVYEEIIGEARELFYEVMNIPRNYRVLFLQGGASLQFAMVPMNLMKTGADYVLTGQFSQKAYEEALLFGKSVNIAGSTKAENYNRIPRQDELKLDPNADYLHICHNNTIFGSRYNYIPETAVPVVADMSSCILSEPVDISRYGLIYAGAQKNIAPAGLTVVIIREDLICDPMAGTPTMLNYKIMDKNDSMYNTPPTYPIYICMLVLRHLKSLGGLAAMAEINNRKANEFYSYLDESALFTNPVNKPDRSIMNVVFKTPSEELDELFVKEAVKAGFVNLKGHRSVGGMRASIYNAMPAEGVSALVEFMKRFEMEHK